MKGDSQIEKPILCLPTDRKALTWIRTRDSVSTEDQYPTPEKPSVGHCAFLDSGLSPETHSNLFGPGNAPTEDNGVTYQERGKSHLQFYPI